MISGFLDLSMTPSTNYVNLWRHQETSNDSRKTPEWFWKHISDISKKQDKKLRIPNYENINKSYYIKNVVEKPLTFLWIMLDFAWVQIDRLLPPLLVKMVDAWYFFEIWKFAKMTIRKYENLGLLNQTYFRKKLCML